LQRISIHIKAKISLQAVVYIMTKDFQSVIQQYKTSFHPVVEFDAVRDKLIAFDFTEHNKALTAGIIEDTNRFCQYIDEQLEKAGAKFGIGGYGEHRTIYNRSRVFDAPHPGEEPRRLHLGTDIWGKPGTPVYAFMDSTIHSFGFNDQYGDYGATLVLHHELNGFGFFTLYGHLCLADIKHINNGDVIKKGACIAHFGIPKENGHWPPHLHFQVILQMEGKQGDYNGVCKYSEKEKYLSKCPDPDGILQMNRYISG
jgi:murein DD-endopeptidase MepM/ murein hydrolase activator NlpD